LIVASDLLDGEFGAVFVNFVCPVTIFCNFFSLIAWYDVQLDCFYHVVVATDDERIAECCRGFGADVIMTSASCPNGGSHGSNYVANIQLFML